MSSSSAAAVARRDGRWSARDGAILCLGRPAGDMSDVAYIHMRSGHWHAFCVCVCIRCPAQADVHSHMVVGLTASAKETKHHGGSDSRVSDATEDHLAVSVVQERNAAMNSYLFFLYHSLVKTCLLKKRDAFIIQQFTDSCCTMFQDISKITISRDH